MKTFYLPDLGEGLPEAEIIAWKIKVGELLKVDQPMLEVENAKAVMEIPAPFAGRVIKLYGQKGDIIETGKALIDIEPESGSSVSSDDAGTVVGQMVIGHEVMQAERAEVFAKKTASIENIKVTPAVRAQAKQMGVDLSSVRGTGKDGMILASDLSASKKESSALEGAIPLKGARRAMAHFMALSHQEIVPTTLMDDVDIHAWENGTQPTLRLIRAIILASKSEPALNAWYDSKNIGRKIIPKIDLGIAVDTEEGLFVPVIRDAASKTFSDLRSEIQGIKERVKSKSITAEEMRAPTIVLSNVGTIAGRYASPVILPPTVAILASGKIRDEVVVFDKMPVVHRVLPLSLTFDHRAVTGGESARFLGALMADLQLSV